MGAHLIKDAETIFDVEGGLGYRRSEEQGTGDVLNEAIAIASVQYYRRLTETTRFESDLSVEAGQDNTYVETVLGVKVKINDHLALKVGYTLKHNSDVPDDTKNTDAFTNLSAR